MKDCLTIMEFVLKHNQDLRNKYSDIKSTMPQKWFKIEPNKKRFCDVGFIDHYQDSFGDENYHIINGRNKNLDKEFMFYIPCKPLADFAEDLRTIKSVELGVFYVEDGDVLHCYEVSLVDENTNLAIVTKQTARSRENYNLVYEPDSETKIAVSRAEIDELFSAGVNV